MSTVRSICQHVHGFWGGGVSSSLCKLAVKVDITETMIAPTVLMSVSDSTLDSFILLAFALHFSYSALFSVQTVARDSGSVVQMVERKDTMNSLCVKEKQMTWSLHRVAILWIDFWRGS